MREREGMKACTSENERCSILPLVSFSILPRYLSASVSFEPVYPSQTDLQSTRILKDHLLARTSDLALVTNYLSCTYASEMPVKRSPRFGYPDTEITGSVARVITGVLPCAQVRIKSPESRQK